jgi:hypothetical protein
MPFWDCHLAFQGVNMLEARSACRAVVCRVGCSFIAVNLVNLSPTKRPPFKTDFVQPPRLFHAASTVLMGRPWLHV